MLKATKRPDECADDSGRAPRKKRRPNPTPSTHGMRTRARAKTFELMSFPPEVRNLVYTHMYTDTDGMEIEQLRLPSSLRVPGIFTEALPIFFESTPVTISVRSNWCIRNAHIHKRGHPRYESTGKFDLSDTLSRIRESLVRFRKVSFIVSCCCCDNLKDIARIDIGSSGQEISCEKEVTCRGILEDEKPLVVEGLEKMLDAAEKLVRTEMKARDGFNGFSIADLETVAMCFRDT